MLSKNQAREIRSLQLKKFRDSRKLFLAEGVKTVSEIMAGNPDLIQTIYAEAHFLERFSEEIKKKKIQTVEISETELRNISLQKNPNHVLAVCAQPAPEQKAETNFKGFSFYLDDIRDPGNFGTILRLCDWFGVRHLFCSPACCELYNPKVIQASMGAFIRVKVSYVTLNELLANANISNVYGAVLDGKDIYSQRLENGLILIGNEANGISAENLALVNKPLTIPADAQNGSESLNAAMATSIIASEFFRQVRGK